jgi:hypothetical protein
MCVCITQVGDLQPLIQPCSLDGAFIVDARHGTSHLHFSVPNTMYATMGPSSYQHILRMALGEDGWWMMFGWMEGERVDLYRMALGEGP